MNSSINKLNNLYNDLKKSFSDKNPYMIQLKNIIDELILTANTGIKIENTDYKNEKKNIHIADEIINIISSVFKCRTSDIKGKKRIRHIVRARQLTCYILTKNVGLSLMYSGTFINRDHATVYNSSKLVEKLEKTDKLFKQQKQEVYKQIGIKFKQNGSKRQSECNLLWNVKLQ